MEDFTSELSLGEVDCFNFSWHGIRGIGKGVELCLHLYSCMVYTVDMDRQPG